MINFTNKIITTNLQSIPISINSPISKRISSNLWNTFSNLNFSGVYKIGSETDLQDCYIGSSYNITLKITHHLNLLYRGEHHSKGLQEWVNKNGLENIDISVLSRCKADPNEFENREQYFLNKIKPKFNAILNKRIINVEFKDSHYINYCNTKILNEFGNPIVTDLSKNCKRVIMKFINNSEIDEDRKYWKPTIIIIDENGTVNRSGGDITIIPKKKVEVKPTYVKRNVGFIGR
ncbi:MAG: hypothetical protein M0R17_06895 [Candidatus Omnitrophica bacterium]|jgi:hypothetical protein|nr:hypothetical protein [Candidatus Omnitrophota bacterium]